mgnify:CR=1 FL=1
MSALPLNASEFWRGFKSILPFWVSTAPFALTYVLAGWSAGLGSAEIFGMGLLIESAATQMSLVQFVGTQTPPVIILLTLAAMNIHFLLYGVSLAKHIALSRGQRFVAAYFLTDGVYGMIMGNRDAKNLSFLLGAGVSICTAWNVSTLIGCIFGDSLVNLLGEDLDFAVPLGFATLLVSVIRTRSDLSAAIVAALVAVLCAAAQLGGMTTLIVSLSGLLLGIVWTRRHEVAPA